MLKHVSWHWLAVPVLVLAGALVSCGGVDQEIPDSEPTQEVVGAVPETLDVAITGDTTVVGFDRAVPPGVDPDTLPANRGNYIRWQNRLTVPVFVHLDRAPVTPTLVEIPPRGFGWATVLTEAREGTYKYSITLTTAGGQVVELDPHIDVPPPPGD